MPKQANRRKLRNLWIRKDIQLWLVISNALFMLFIACTVIFSVLPPLYDGFQRSGDYQVQHFAAKFFIVILDRLVPTLSAIFVLGSVYTIVITHRICGPLVNLSKTFERISEGDFTRGVHLRRGDFLKREAAMVNNMNDVLSIRFNALIRHHHAVKIKIAELESSGAQDTAIEKTISELSQAVAACCQALDQIKTNLPPNQPKVAAFSARHSRALSA
jgi:hypothetical protein